MTTAQTGKHTQLSSNLAIAGWIQLVLIMVVVISALVLNRLLIQEDHSSELHLSQPSVAVVETVIPSNESTTIRVRETGTIRTRANVSVVPQVSGRIMSVVPEFAAGGFFQRGQVLFSIDPTDFGLAVKQAQAELDSAQSALRLELAEAETAKHEWSLINRKKPIPPLVAREPQIDQAQATVAAAQARLDDANVDLARTSFTMPFDGRVISTTIEVGQTVVANQHYGEVYRTGALEAFVPISIESLARLEPVVGRHVIVEGRMGKQVSQITGRVVRVEAELDSQTRLAGLVINFEKITGFLPGAFVQVEIVGDEVTDVYQLSADLIAAGEVIWVVEGSTLVARRPTILSRQEGMVVVDQFDIGDGVVKTLPAGAKEGLPVTIAASQTPMPRLRPTSSPTAIASE